MKNTSLDQWFTGPSSLAVLIVGYGVSDADNNLQAADGENLGISSCFLGSVGLNFKAMSSPVCSNLSCEFFFRTLLVG